VTGITAGISAGLGVASALSARQAAKQQEQAMAIEEHNARLASVIVYENLKLETRDRVTAYRDFSGAVKNAVASSGVEVGSGITAQMRADALVGLRRDVEALRLNADAQATRLGFGPESYTLQAFEDFGVDPLAATDAEIAEWGSTGEMAEIARVRNDAFTMEI